MSRLHSIAALCLAAALLIGACAPSATPPAQPPAATTAAPQNTQPPANAPLVLTDGMGREVRLAAPAQRVVSLAPSNTEILFAVGAGKQTVGRDELSDYPAEAKQVSSIGSTYGKLNTEAIVALKPDLVLAAGTTPPEQIKTLEDLKLTVYVVGNPATLEEMYANLQAAGTLTGHAAGATALVDTLKTRAKAVQDKLAGVSTRPKVYYELDATDPTKPYTAGKGTFVDLLITLAGGQNIGAALPEAYAQISTEELLKQNPDLIVLGDSAYGTTPEQVKARPGWDGLAAVKSGAIYAFDDNLISRPGPRLIDGLEALARLVHPEALK